jgi:hypothetical protein
MTRLCSIDGCGDPHLARGFCRKHWKLWRRYGDPLHPHRKGTPLKFLKGLLGTSEAACITWPHTRLATGYGTLLFEGRQKTAHRIMCRLRHGEPPTPKHEAAHSCGNGHEGCVNPNHLYWATRGENAADMVRHDRSVRGERNSNAVLTTEDVIRIRALVADGRPMVSVARDYEVSQSCIHSVCSRKTWAHIP